MVFIYELTDFDEFSPVATGTYLSARNTKNLGLYAQWCHFRQEKALLSERQAEAHTGEGYWG